MSCNCKNDKSMVSMIEEQGQKNENNGGLIKYLFKFLAFILFLCLSPFVFLYIIWLVFKMVVLNNSVDILPMLRFIANKIKENNDKEDDDELYITEEDLIMVDVEDITLKKNS